MTRGGAITVAEALSPRHVFTTAWWLYQLAAVAAGSILIALTARIEILLPFSPVPVTGQTFGVLLVAALMGRIRAAATVATYLAEGASGLPMFAGGAAGAAYLFGPTGGYLIGFLPAAYLVGLLAERGWDRNVFLTVLGMAAGSIVIFAFGLPWLSVYVGGSRALPLGFYPFLIGDLVKILAAAVVLPSLRRLV